MITQSIYPYFIHSSHSTPSPTTFQIDLLYVYACDVINATYICMQKKKLQTYATNN